jgi:hypothetical protein
MSTKEIKSIFLTLEPDLSLFSNDSSTYFRIKEYENYLLNRL